MPVIGGATNSLLNLSMACKASGHQIEVVFTRREGNAFDLFSDVGIPWSIHEGVQIYGHAHGAYTAFASLRPWRPIWNIQRVYSTVSKAKSVLAERNADVVYLNTSVLLPWAMAANQLKFPVVWHIREQIHPGILGWRRDWIRATIDRCATSILSISEENKKALGLARARVVYNSVNLELYQSLRKSFQHNVISKGNRLVFLFLGGSVLSKGADLLVEAFLNAFPKGEAVLQIAGKFQSEPDRHLNRIERKVKKLLVGHPASHCVEFLGVLNQLQIAQALSLANVLVWPATVPHFARPIMEAMAMGKPVLAADFSSSRELLIPEVNGILVKPGREKVWREALMNSAQNLEVLERMGAANALVARERFNQEHNHQQIIGELIKASKSRP